MADKPQLVCFDWDGTLIDSFDKIATTIVEVAKRMELPKVSKAKVKEKIGIAFEAFVTDLYGEVDTQVFLAQYLNVYEETPHALLFPGCAQLLSTLKRQKIQVAIVTNKSRLSVMREIERHKLGDLIDSVWVAEELVPKPSPVMLRHAMTSHQAMPNQTWMVGDALPDVYAGYAADCARIILVEKIPLLSWMTNVTIVKQLEDILDCIHESVE